MASWLLLLLFVFPGSAPFAANVDGNKPVVLSLVLVPNEGTFSPETFIPDLAGHLGGLLPERLSIRDAPATLESGHIAVHIRIDNSAHDIGRVKSKAMMLPFGNRVVGGFHVAEESLHNEERGTETGATQTGTSTPAPYWVNTQPTVHVLKIGLLLNTLQAQYSETAVINSMAQALSIPSDNIWRRELSETVDPMVVFNKNWVQLQASRVHLDQGIAVIFSLSGIGSVVDAALSKTVDLPWTVPGCTTVVAGVMDRPISTSPGDHFQNAEEHESVRCGAEQRELCIAVVVNTSAAVLETPWFQQKLAAWVQVDENRLRSVSVQHVAAHPSWAHIKIDKGESTAGMMMATFAMQEGRPNLDQVYHTLLTPLFHTAEVARVSAGLVEYSSPPPPTPPARRYNSMRMSGYL